MVSTVIRTGRSSHSITFGFLNSVSFWETKLIRNFRSAAHRFGGTDTEQIIVSQRDKCCKRGMFKVLCGWRGRVWQDGSSKRKW
jgi:hypothetical protein